jgi:hypothetical protein
MNSENGSRPAGGRGDSVVAIGRHGVAMVGVLVCWFLSGCDIPGLYEEEEDSPSTSSAPPTAVPPQQWVVPTDDGQAGEFAGDGALTATEESYIKGLLDVNADAPGWPARPRRTGSFSESQSNSTTISVGARGSLFGLVDGESTAASVFGMSHRSTIVLIRTSPGATAPLTKPGEEGDMVELNYEDGIDFVGQCVYSASLQMAQRFVGSASMMGNSVSNQTEFSQATEMVLSTNFFSIQEGDTVEGVLEICENIFDEYIKHTLAMDMRRLVTASFVVDVPLEPDDTYLAFESAAQGPSRDGLSVMGETWDVRPFSWARRGPAEREFHIWGSLGHDGLLWNDDDVNFHLIYRDGELADGSDTGVAPDSSGWERSAYELITTLGDEVYLENRIGLENMHPGEALVVRASEECNVEPEQMVSLGTGRYTAYGLARQGVQPGRLSSLHIPQGMRVALYLDGELRGDRLVLTAGDYPCLAEGWNDRVSSMIVEPDGEAPRPYVLFNHFEQAYLSAETDGGSSIAQEEVGGLWFLRHATDGYYHLTHERGGLLVAGDGGATTLTAEDNEGAHWALVEAQFQQNAFVLINRVTGQALTVDRDESSQPYLLLREVDRRANQAWMFEVPPPPEPAEPSTESPESPPDVTDSSSESTEPQPDSVTE